MSDERKDRPRGYQTADRDRADRETVVDTIVSLSAITLEEVNESIATARPPLQGRGALDLVTSSWILSRPRSIRRSLRLTR
jgi:hypothetical protein